MNFLKSLLSKEDLPARIISLVVAIGLWIYVMTGQNPIVERSTEIRLRQSNLPADMVAFNIPDRVLVKVRGTRIMVSSNLENEIVAKVDLQNVTPGQQTLPVEVNFEGGEVLSMSPQEISLFVDTVSEKNVPVVPRVVGEASNDMVLGESTITPPQVIVRGATHKLKRVNKVAAPINVTDHTGNFQTETELVAVGDDGYDVPHMRITPAKAQVVATMVSQMLSNEVPIKLVTSGAIPEGVVVTRAEIVPETIRLTAPPSVLAELKEVRTKSVDITGLDGSTALAVELDLPDKVIPEVRSVQLKISVERQPVNTDETENKNK